MIPRIHLRGGEREGGELLRSSRRRVEQNDRPPPPLEAAELRDEVSVRGNEHHHCLLA